MRDDTILQVVLNMGWQAVYATRDHTGRWYAKAEAFPVWALLESSIGFRGVVGFGGLEYPKNVEEDDHFLGYLGPGQDLESWNIKAREYGRQQTRQIVRERIAVLN